MKKQQTLCTVCREPRPPGGCVTCAELRALLSFLHKDDWRKEDPEECEAMEILRRVEIHRGRTKGIRLGR